ncbi:histidine phosphatase family protein [Actinomadura kijaniata]|uniref:histidine phosphatase family protein n=1 Tax=Actinomadura kijaniata TaxID=46161 RepID=UPI000A7795FA|nr:histidine phosphatase family protein [Actinomadura kijaniata]
MGGRDEVIEYRQERYRPPAGAVTVLLVRHGASRAARADAPFPLVGGHADPELAAEGHRQAERVCARLAGERLDAVYVTTLRRTAQTAAPLVRRLGIEPRVEADLREVHLGAWEGGLFRRMVAEDAPEARRLWAEERWDVIPGAESNEALAARVRRGIDRIAAAHPGGRVAVFTHGGVIAQALSLAAGARPLAFLGTDNCSISELVVIGERWSVRRFNDTAHLDGPGDGALT